MHVLIPVLHRPLQPTGVCRHAANLAQCLADIEEVTQVTLVTGAWQKYYFEKVLTLSSEKIRLIDINIKNSSLSRNSWFLFGLPKLVNSLQPNIVHMSFPIPFFRWQYPCSVVTTIHDLYPFQCPENFGTKQVLFNRLFLKKCIDNSDGLSCVSQSTLEYLKFYFPKIHLKKKTTAIYNYVNLNNICIKVPSNHDGIQNIPFILCVAQHRKNKNLALLIQAYSLLLKQKQLTNATKLVIVGSSGPETENIYHQIYVLSLQEQIRLISAVNDDELCWLYRNCQLFVIPSSIEGFCLPLAEALSLSCKVVCSDIRILREIGLSNCTYFDLQGEPVENLAHAIIHSLNRSNFNKNYDDSRFKKADIANQYLQLYLELM
ncbi:MAG: glycosyltransferase family 4 protein [Chroococcidiopsidaceae cyanobacterium CP_BM_RX_35]|nr:glycosyltransferase family 4 protein [Chroococcidiopsidaceae cyanobacterium CP_BM_RX_35]